MASPAPVSAAVNRLWTPRLSLTACVRGVVARDTRGLDLHPLQRMNYFPASPLCSISWWFEGRTEMIRAPLALRDVTLDDPRDPIVPRTVLVGPFETPSVSWNVSTGCGMMLLLLPDALQLLTGIDPASLLNRYVDAHEALPADWRAMCRQVAEAPDNEARVTLIEDFLDPRWEAVRPHHAMNAQRYQDWVQGLSMRAARTAAGRSLRQVERRIKQWVGQPMRELQGISRVERAFYEVVAASGAGRLHWADIAADCGYSDQSHLTRATRRITGFAPEELRRRIYEDEGFWMYRLWM